MATQEGIVMNELQPPEKSWHLFLLSDLLHKY